MSLQGAIRRNRWRIYAFASIVWFALIASLFVVWDRDVSDLTLAEVLFVAIIPFVATWIFHARRKRDWFE